MTLAGRGRDATLITSTHEFGTLRINSNTEVRSLTASNVGVPSSDSAFPAPFGIGGFVDPAPNVGPISNVRLTDVSGKSIAASGTNNARQGIYLCANQSFITNVTAEADGGNFSLGLRADCADGGAMFIDGLKVSSKGGALGVRGAYLAGGGPWKDIQAFVRTTATAQTVFGIRVFTNTATAGSVLINPLINIESPVDYMAHTDPGGVTIDGLRIERAEVAVRGGSIHLSRLNGTYMRGINATHYPADFFGANIHDTDVWVEVLDTASALGGSANGIQLNSSGGELVQVKVKVECEAATNVPCTGILRRQATVSVAPQGMLFVSNANVFVTQENPGVGGISRAVNVAAGDIGINNSRIHTFQLTQAEPSATLLVGNSASLQALNSALLSDGPFAVGVGGTLGSVGTGVLRLHSNSLLGTITGTAVCIGNSTLADAFLATTCP